MGGPNHAGAKDAETANLLNLVVTTMLDPKQLAEYNEFRQTKNKAIFCHAPFSSMNFAQDGKATVCCYNRSHVLGTYPKDSIEDMWYGTQADHLRGLLRRNALPRGCQICLDQLQSRNFGGLRARFYDRHAAEAWSEAGEPFHPRPKVMEFEISNVCNLECTMCNGFFSSAIRKHREGLPQLKRPYDARFVKQLEAFIPHLTEAKFLGGEPFLNHLYYQIWELIARIKPDIRITIITNGTILTDKVKAILEPLNAHIDMSIDALDPANYERIRVNAKFEQVMENLAYFREFVARKKTSMTMSVCPMQQNWHEMPQILQFCNERDITLFFNTVYFPESASLRCLPRAQLREIVEYLEEVEFPANGRIQWRNRANYLDLIHQIVAFRDRTVVPDYENFSDIDMADSRWSLSTASGNAADLALPSDESESVRVTIQKAPTSAPWDIQVNKARIPIESDHHYMMLFRARAAYPRNLCFGIAPADGPRDDLGKHRNVRLTPDWQSFQMVFGPTPRGGDARLHFDVGGNDAMVELSDVSLQGLAATSTIQ
jgi:MoaA/NifB/PqqE/SkfB family radical SAM enzyme